VSDCLTSTSAPGAQAAHNHARTVSIKRAIPRKARKSSSTVGWRGCVESRTVPIMIEEASKPPKETRLLICICPPARSSPATYAAPPPLPPPGPLVVSRSVSSTSGTPNAGESARDDSCSCSLVSESSDRK
jgi:hypothetical protein